MQTIDIPEMKQAISHIALNHREPVMFWGQPGLGKTDVVYQSCQEHGGILVDVRLGQYESVDLRGIPVPHEHTTVWHMPATLPFKGNPKFDTADNRGRPIYLFLDEFNQCHPSVFGVSMQLTNERRVGEHELMDEVIIICAGNRETDRAVTNRMPTTVSNRLTHFEVALNEDEWCFWAQEHLPAAAAGVGVAFIQFRKVLLSTFDPAKPDKAFATPRSWAKALTFFADPKMPENIKMAAMAGAVGQGPSAEFWGFVDVWQKMPDLKAIAKDPTKVAVPDEAAMRYAVTVAISGAMTQETIPAFAQYLERMEPQFVILAWQLAIKRDPSVCRTKEFVSMSKQCRAVFATA